MKIELVTFDEAKKLGLIHNILLHEGHGAFGEPDNTYEDIVYIGKKIETISHNDLILFDGKSPNREVLQIISEWNSSDKLLEVINPKALSKRKKEKYEKYLKLKMEIESDDFYLKNYIDK